MSAFDPAATIVGTMRCIFCKHDAAASRSREHIVPESLGNTEHVLRPGIVCDGCNNYLARKVEAPFLDSGYVRAARFHAAVGNKRGVVPTIRGLHLQSRAPIEFLREPGMRDVSVGTVRERDELRFIRALGTTSRGTIVAPIEKPPDDYVVSRFVAKVALEALALRVCDVPGAIDEIVDKPELDDLRAFVRRGAPGQPWPVRQGRLYAPDTHFLDGTQTFEVLHEFTFLYTERNELFFVLAIFGEEFAINLAAHSLSGYAEWVDGHGGRSPLYPHDSPR